ncbi:hypothetical protein [Pseudodonghicola sp.]|uniref:hypothetical protein n=1 Tax=Pseudodonghicola sp. TaxID=1969463 RepID=UPI003A9807A3
MRYLYAALILGGLSACAPAVPDSGAGFNSSLDAQRTRDAELAGATASLMAPPTAVSSAPLAAAGTLPTQAPLGASSMQMAAGEDSAAEIAREAAAALGEVPVVATPVAPLQASPSNPVPTAISNSGISDENDFKAVASRESIQSDAERMARNREQYQQVQPTALPTRTGSTGPNIVQYALRTTNPRGMKLYSRSPLQVPGRAARSCARYGSADLAQMAFLEKGGPERDWLGLDPDGDGFACNWDPAPFRQAALSSN